MLNPKQFDSEMRNAVAQTLEQTAFTVVDVLSEDRTFTSCNTIESCITVTLHDMSFLFAVRFPELYISGIVDTIYYNSIGNRSSFYQDTVDELTNTICGNFSRAIETTIGAFTLSIPNQVLPSNWQPVAVYSFLLDDMYPLEIMIG